MTLLLPVSILQMKKLKRGKLLSWVPSSCKLKVKLLSRFRLWDPLDCSLPGFSVHGILQARILEWITISFSRDLPDPGIEPGSLALEADVLTSEPPRKPKNTGVGCHARLQGIFPTQRLNQVFLTCRQILYCLSHQGSLSWEYLSIVM